MKAQGCCLRSIAPAFGMVEHRAEDFEAAIARAGAAGVRYSVEPGQHVSLIDLVDEFADKGVVEVAAAIVGLGVERPRLPLRRGALPVEIRKSA
jgi:hypothetical protein